MHRGKNCECNIKCQDCLSNKLEPQLLQLVIAVLWPVGYEQWLRYSGAINCACVDSCNLWCACLCGSGGVTGSRNKTIEKSECSCQRARCHVKRLLLFLLLCCFGKVTQIGSWKTREACTAFLSPERGNHSVWCHDRFHRLCSHSMSRQSTDLNTSPHTSTWKEHFISSTSAVWQKSLFLKTHDSNR